jgi:pyruvate/2-oxoglutarate dehydrogenase complex dihydrolipoamide dehydrogenase (E3) component
MERVDAVIVGSGQGGVPLAVDLARDGKSVVLFERGRLGGTCINYGCTPSKAFLAACHTGARARLAGPLGVRADISIDFPAVMKRVRSIRDSFGSQIRRRLDDARVRVVEAEASFVGERTVAGGGVVVAAELVVIDTGTTASAPPMKGLAGAGYMTNETFFDQERLPASMAVLGGGYIGLELGQGMARAGCEVHVIDPNARVLGREEDDASAALETALAQDGVRMHLGRTAREVSRDGSGFTVLLDDGSTVKAAALLVAAGRVPNTAALHAQAGGVRLDGRGYVIVDETLRTTAEGTYAIGDVAGQPAFTHVSWEDYRRLKAILAGQRRTRNDRVLAYSTFTEPQVARVGVTLDEARKAGLNAKAVTIPIDKIARAVEWGQSNGFYRLVIDADSDKIIGATMVGYETAELVHVVLAHMEAGSTWQVLDRSVHVHPTYAEGLPTLARMFEA